MIHIYWQFLFTIESETNISIVWQTNILQKYSVQQNV